jgi:hypothetical protein
MRKRLLIVLALLVVAGAISWRVFQVSELARIGAGYAAEQTCACLFISKRSLESCKGDLEPMARWLVSITPGDGEVSARSVGVATATARYHQGFGCAFE